MTFNELHTSFEKKETDLFELQKQEGFSKYILIRSLGKEHLKELIAEHSDDKDDSGNYQKLYSQLYSSTITIDQLIVYINGAYPAVREERIENEEHLSGIIENFGQVRCGIRNDNLNDTAKELVRDKSITSKEELEEKIDAVYDNTIKDYILWQYYNQVTNDLIEHIFNDHDVVIPSLRKIKYVDFFIKIDDQIIPFDLKITHISDNYFDLHEKGLENQEEGNDSYSVLDNESEVERIKAKYKEVKRDLKLPNYGGLSKEEMLEILQKTGNEDLQNFVRTTIGRRAEIVNEIEQDLVPVEWWNYKFQGERLFKNNNRFFVLLSYTNSFTDARPIKGNLEEINVAVTAKLDTLVEDGMNEIRYFYEKDRGLEGAYTVLSTSILVTNEYAEN